MYTVYHVDADELDDQFLQSLKSTFRHKKIQIAVSEEDETAYLLRSPANREHLLHAVADATTGRNLVTPDQTPFK